MSVEQLGCVVLQHHGALTKRTAGKHLRPEDPVTVELGIEILRLLTQIALELE